MFGVQIQLLPQVSNSSVPAAPGDILLAAEPSQGLLAKLGLPSFDSERIGTEGYMLDIRSDRIVIAANSGTGVAHAVQTLVQLMHAADGRYFMPSSNRIFVRSCTVTDWPDGLIRGIFMYGEQTNNMNLSYIESMLKRMQRTKMNTNLLH
eukprot:SAG31_NODE_17268_length_677_cov_1.152249_2_plen_149_part_01